MLTAVLAFTAVPKLIVRTLLDELTLAPELPLTTARVPAKS